MSKIAWFEEYNINENILYILITERDYIITGGDLNKKNSKKLKKVN